MVFECHKSIPVWFLKPPKETYNRDVRGPQRNFGNDIIHFMFKYPKYRPFHTFFAIYS